MNFEKPVPACRSPSESACSGRSFWRASSPPWLVMTSLGLPPGRINARVRTSKPAPARRSNSRFKVGRATVALVGTSRSCLCRASGRCHLSSVRLDGGVSSLTKRRPLKVHCVSPCMKNWPSHRRQLASNFSHHLNMDDSAPYFPPMGAGGEDFGAHHAPGEYQ